MSNNQALRKCQQAEARVSPAGRVKHDGSFPVSVELLGLESIRLDAIKHLGSKTKVTWILIVLLLVDYTWIATCSEAKAWVSAPGCWNKVWRYLVFASSGIAGLGLGVYAFSSLGLRF